ncbi:hypothetical protein ACMXYW_07275 [Neptuniibacter sp. QD48_55]|uniref:hypothetical protein n=1 Tax=Neptuniibacter sp. QD48_55 TaxID=3398212 RepID=UPI0039F592EE
MNTKINLLVASIALTAGIATPLTAVAEDKQYTCSYTHASYTAPFMKAPKTRNCPQGRCSYSVVIKNDSAVVNGVAGFSVEQSDEQIKLSRTAKDPVMGGMDTTNLTINKSDMSFQSVKTTTPSVVLTTQGSCS